MKNFILDASITLAWCFSDEATPVTTLLLERLEKETAFVPTLWSLEIGNILIAAERRKRINYAQLIEFLSLLKTVNIQIDGETSNRAFHETLMLAYTERLTTYDASYLELAMRMGLPLATKDKELQKAAVRLGLKII